MRPGNVASKRPSSPTTCVIGVWPVTAMSTDPRGSALPLTVTSTAFPPAGTWKSCPSVGASMTTATAGATTEKVTVAVPEATPPMDWVAVAVYVPTGRSANSTS
ncbi:hypothetical protein BC477_16710 [Clavibacter michiganensis subsp. michiganensis]|uniref:Uncharacterized protein n=1 Tax=Clavibacter michiganensis subsp. michiganensis TaxID=33013 RepID=A0A251XEI5_CLAMM|nr:hypothetical protein BC477_16710 [Clavibacter michiganensis subsp. michiganensis]OUE00450.1 hypothetical protein CMMCAS07_18790 [Clavibacter michiganensis subsp. michiganensis]